MSEAKSTLHNISEEAGEVLGEVTSLLEAEGKEDLPLARRIRLLHERLSRQGQELAAGGNEGEDSTGKPGAGEPGAKDVLEATCMTQHAALELIASGVRPSQGDRGPTMLTVRETRAIAQSALHHSEVQPTGREAGTKESKRSPAREAERLRDSVHSGDLHGAKRQARMILEHNEMPDVSDPATLLLRTFAQTLSGMLEGKIGVDVRQAATSSRVRHEQEERQAAERRAEQVEQESAELRRSLAWYAKEANYRAIPDGHDGRQRKISESAIKRDQGRRAHQALDNSEAGRQIARRLEAAETFIELLRVNLANHEQEISPEISQHDPAPVRVKAHDS